MMATHRHLHGSTDKSIESGSIRTLSAMSVCPDEYCGKIGGCRTAVGPWPIIEQE